MAALAPLVFSAEEEAKLRRLYDHLDVDRKGYITHEDLRRLCSELGREITAEKAEELILRCDPEKLGRIGWEPFVRALSVAIPKIIAAIILVGLFKAIDVDNSGYISRAELERIVLESGAKIEQARLNELILKTSPLPDGRIEFRAFCAGLVAHLRSI
jgi:Ca2+-binding EF-hand superfamily protein